LGPCFRDAAAFDILRRKLRSARAGTEAAASELVSADGTDKTGHGMVVESGRVPNGFRFPTRPSSQTGVSECTKEAIMPLIQVKVIEAVSSESKRRKIVRKLTDAMVSIEGESMRPVTWVVIEEIKSGDGGMGGKSLTTADVKAFSAG